MDFETFLTKTRAKQPSWQPPHILVALDPGETTGYAIFVQGKLHAIRQLATKDIATSTDILRHLNHFATLDPNAYQIYQTRQPKQTDKTIKALYEPFLPSETKGRPDIIVYENYKVYSWKTENHAWAGLHTPQLIGCIETLARLYDIPTYTQMAQQAKHFCTDTKLKEWGLYNPGMRHAMDAVRHACYYLLFNHPEPTPI